MTGSDPVFPPSVRVSPTRWILVPQPRPQASVQLLCLAHAGGGASTYHGWSAQLRPQIEVGAVQLPGHETRMSEPLMTSLGQLVENLAEAVVPRLDRPYALYGHSLGALIAFELARALRGRGQPLPRHLIVSGRPAPHLPVDDLPVAGAGDAEFVDVIAERYGGIPDAVRAEPELMALFVPVLRADLLLAQKYLYREEEPLACPLSAFGGLADTTVGAEAGAAWGTHTSQSFSFERLPGGHFFPGPSRARLLEAIESRLLG
jgi:medium-chain acyl-[acyl-carrier-protein] hydrolase